MNRIIGIAGRMESGKTTIASHLAQTYGYTEDAFANGIKLIAKDLGWNGIKDAWGRYLLQTIGASARLHIDSDVWVTSLAKRSMWIPKLVISDVRHMNECLWISDHGGVIIRVTRPSIDRSGPEHQHASEADVETLPAAYDVVNDSTIDILLGKIDIIMQTPEATRITPTRFSSVPY